MNSNNLIENLKCALLNYDHIVQEPLSLNCGHCICKTCSVKENKFYCKICNKITDREMKDENESIVFNTIIYQYLPELFVELEKKASNRLKGFKGRKF
jgi:hypothetical protein